MTSLASQQISSEFRGGAVGLEKREIDAAYELDMLSNAAEGIGESTKKLGKQDRKAIRTFVERALYDIDGQPFELSIRKATLQDVEDMLRYIINENLTADQRRNIVDTIAAEVIDSNLDLEPQYHHDHEVAPVAPIVQPEVLAYESPRRPWVAKLAQAAHIPRVNVA